MSFNADGLNAIRALGAIGTGAGSVNTLWGYVTNDTLAQVETDGYFDTIADKMATGDIIVISYDRDGTEGHVSRTVTATASDVALTAGHGVAAVTDSSGGTADGTLAAVSGSGADATINNNFADLAAKLNALIAAT